MTLKTAIAAPFRHTRKEALKRADFIYYVTIEKKWMNREQADLFISRAIAGGLIGSAGGILTPTFDLSEVTIPLGFRPGPEIFEQDDPLQELIRRIVTATGASPTQVAAEMNQLIRETFDGNLLSEAAAVIMARKYGVPFEDLLGQLAASVCAEKKQ